MKGIPNYKLKSNKKKEIAGFFEKFTRNFFILSAMLLMFVLLSGSAIAWNTGADYKGFVTEKILSELSGENNDATEGYDKDDFNVIDVGPGNYTDEVSDLEAGDWLALEAGTYTDSIYPDDLQGTKENPIVISGPEDGGEVVLERHGYANTIEFGNSHNLVIRNLRLDGSTNDEGMAIRARHDSYTSNITLENLHIHDYDVGSQTAIDTSNDAVAFGWTIRNVTIDGASTGMYFGCASGEDGAFIGGRIEDSVIKDTHGYNIQVKHQNHRDFGYDIPEGPHRTIVRNNTFKRAGRDSYRPNLLLGHFPDQGAGSDDRYLVYGNIFYETKDNHSNVQTDSTAAFYNNLFVNTDGDGGIYAYDHNDNPRDLHIFRNTFLTDDTAIDINDVDTDYEQVVKGNAIFSDSPYSLDDNVIEENNSEAGYDDKGDLLINPSADDFDELDLRPIDESLNKDELDYGDTVDNLDIDFLPFFENDFTGIPRKQPTYGAYASETGEVYTLDIGIGGEGSTYPSEGTHTYEEGEEVEVTATPDAGWYFEEWAGDVPTGEEGEEITVTMDQDRDLTAYFEQEDHPEEYELTINVEGEGSTVPEEGSHTYEEGEEVEITATPVKGWYFEEWAGDYDGTDEGINVTMDDEKQLTAHFIEEDEVQNIFIDEQPRLEYTEGEELDLTDMVVELDYENIESEFVDYGHENLTNNPEHGTELETENDGESVLVTHVPSGKKAKTNPLDIEEYELESYYPHYEPIILNDEEQEFYVEVTDPQDNEYFVEWYVDGDNVENGTEYTYEADGESGKEHREIKVNATNLQRDATITWNLTQTDHPVTRELDGDTTDLSEEENLENVTNLTLEKTDTGRVSFGEASVNLSGIANLDPFIRMQNSVVGLDSEALETFEQPATIHMYGLNFSSVPKIYHSENFTKKEEDILKECPEEKCFNIDYSAANGILSFDVANFSSYRAAIDTGEMPKREEPEEKDRVSRSVKVPHLRFIDEVVQPGEEAIMQLNLENLEVDDLEGLRVRLGLPELGVYRTAGPFDLEYNEDVYRQINLRVPYYAQPGIYTARITVTDSNNDVRRTIHRELIVE